MTKRLEGKVAFITGAARGQGRAHAVRMAQEGADIVAVDICKTIDSNPYPLASPEDLATTERLVIAVGGRMVACEADVRDRTELRRALETGVAKLGRLDIVLANAGICPMGSGIADASAFVDATDVDLIGVMNTVAVAAPHLADHGSIVITGSTAAMIAGTASNPSAGSGGSGYQWAKQVLAQYTEQLALQLAPRFIRVNAIHPTNCNTAMLHNRAVYGVFRPDLEEPTEADVLPAFTYFHAMPVPYVQPEDIANVAVFLASDESRFVTGQQIRVDAGAVLKWPTGPAA